MGRERTRDAVSSGNRGISIPAVLAALALLMVLVLLLVLRSGGDGGGQATGDDEPTGLVPTVTACRAAGDTLWTEGTLRNAATILIRNIEMSFVWTDEDGEEVASEVVELVRAEGLMAGETTAFQGFTTVDGAVDCQASVFFFEPLN